MVADPAGFDARRPGRGARLPRRVRVARRARRQATPPRLPRGVRRRANLRRELGDHRQPARTRRGARGDPPKGRGRRRRAETIAEIWRGNDDPGGFFPERSSSSASESWVVVDEDASPRAGKTFLVWTPPTREAAQRARGKGKKKTTSTGGGGGEGGSGGERGGGGGAGVEPRVVEPRGKAAVAARLRAGAGAGAGAGMGAGAGAGTSDEHVPVPGALSGVPLPPPGVRLRSSRVVPRPRAPFPHRRDGVPSRRVRAPRLPLHRVLQDEEAVRARAPLRA